MRNAAFAVCESAILKLVCSAAQTSQYLRNFNTDKGDNLTIREHTIYMYHKIKFLQDEAIKYLCTKCLQLKESVF